MSSFMYSIRFVRIFSHVTDTIERHLLIWMPWQRTGSFFTNAFAQSTWTRPSGACLLTSTYASVHGVETMEGRVPESIPTLPKILQEKGFMTVGISSMGNISVPYGFGNGFDRYVELYKDSSLAGKRQKFYGRER